MTAGGTGLFFEVPICVLVRLVIVVKTSKRPIWAWNKLFSNFSVRNRILLAILPLPWIGNKQICTIFGIFWKTVPLCMCLKKREREFLLKTWKSTISSDVQWSITSMSREEISVYNALYIKVLIERKNGQSIL